MQRHSSQEDSDSTDQPRGQRLYRRVKEPECGRRHQAQEARIQAKPCHGEWAYRKERTSQSCLATRQTSDIPQSQQWRLANQTKTERTAKEEQLFQPSRIEEPAKIEQRINAKQRIHADSAQSWRVNASQSCNDTEFPPCREEDNPSSLNPECMSHAGSKETATHQWETSQEQQPAWIP